MNFAEWGVVLVILVGAFIFTLAWWKIADRWAMVEKGARAAGRTPNRDNWRLTTYMYLAETREQAWADVREGIMRETEYFSSIGFEGFYAAEPGQRFEKFTAESCVDRRDWVVGTPDDAIAWIEGKIEETGGFGGVMLTAHEWCSFEKIKHSVELFARYVMPRFQGYNAAYQDEWLRIKAKAREHNSGKPFTTGGRPSNLWKS